MASDRDISALWQGQPPDLRPSADEIRARADAFETRSRWWRTAGAVVVALAVVAGAVEAAWPGQSVIERTGDLLTVAAFLYISYRYRRDVRLVTNPAARALMTCLEFHRAQLVREWTLARAGRHYLLPFVPGVALSLVGDRVVSGGSTAAIVGGSLAGVALFLTIAALNAHTSRALRREIDAIDGW